MKNPIIINTTLKKSTKNTHVYEAEGTAIPSVYIQKNELPDPPPKTITLTLDY